MCGTVRAGLVALALVVVGVAWGGCGDNQITGFGPTPTPTPSPAPTPSPVATRPGG